MVGAAGFEPAASCSQGRRANQTALRPDTKKRKSNSRIGLEIAGSSGRIRTADRVINSHLLYQLSYRGIFVATYSILTGTSSILLHVFFYTNKSQG